MTERACTRSTQLTVEPGVVLDVFKLVEQATGAVRWLALLLSAAAAALPVAKEQGLDAAVLAFNDAMKLSPDLARIRDKMYYAGLTISLPAAMCALMCDGVTNGICLNQLDPHPSTYSSPGNFVATATLLWEAWGNQPVTQRRVCSALFVSVLTTFDGETLINAVGDVCWYMSKSLLRDTSLEAGRNNMLVKKSQQVSLAMPDDRPSRCAVKCKRQEVNEKGGDCGGRQGEAGRGAGGAGGVATHVKSSRARTRQSKAGDEATAATDAKAKRAKTKADSTAQRKGGSETSDVSEDEPYVPDVSEDSEDSEDAEDAEASGDRGGDKRLWTLPAEAYSVERGQSLTVKLADGLDLYCASLSHPEVYRHLLKVGEATTMTADLKVLSGSAGMYYPMARYHIHAYHSLKTMSPEQNEDIKILREDPGTQGGSFASYAGCASDALEKLTAELSKDCQPFGPWPPNTLFWRSYKANSVMPWHIDGPNTESVDVKSDGAVPFTLYVLKGVVGGTRDGKQDTPPPTRGGVVCKITFAAAPEHLHSWSLRDHTLKGRVGGVWHRVKVGEVSGAARLAVVLRHRTPAMDKQLARKCKSATHSVSYPGGTETLWKDMAAWQRGADAQGDGFEQLLRRQDPPEVGPVSICDPTDFISKLNGGRGQVVLPPLSVDAAATIVLPGSELPCYAPLLAHFGMHRPRRAVHGVLPMATGLGTKASWSLKSTGIALGNSVVGGSQTVVVSSFVVDFTGHLTDCNGWTECTTKGAYGGQRLCHTTQSAFLFSPAADADADMAMAAMLNNMTCSVRVRVLVKHKKIKPLPFSVLYGVSGDANKDLPGLLYHYFGDLRVVGVRLREGSVSPKWEFELKH